MNNKKTEEVVVNRKLLITAYAEDGCAYGHGLPYPLPITNPVWVDTEYIQTAYSMGLAKIIVHNTETPMPLDNELFNKFLDMGFLSPSVIESYKIAPTMSRPKLVGVADDYSPSVREVITVEADLPHINEEGFSGALVAVEMKEFGTNLEVVSPLQIKDDKVSVKFKCIAEGACSFKMQQVRMGENREDKGKEYIIAFTIKPASVPPEVTAIEFDPVKLVRDSIITCKLTLGGDTSHNELLQTKIEGTGSKLVITEPLTVIASNEATIKFKATHVGKTNLKVTQINAGKLCDKIGLAKEVVIEVLEKPQAPTLEKPQPAKVTAYAGDKLKLSSLLTGNLENSDMLNVDIREYRDIAEVTKQFARVESKPMAEAELNLLKSGSMRLEIQQTKMGPEQDQNGVTYISEIEVKDKVAPVIGKFLFPKLEINEEETITASASITGEHTELINIEVTGADEHLKVIEQPAIKEGYSDIQMKVQGGTPGKATLTIKQTKMGPNKDQDGEPQVLHFTIKDAPEAPILGQPVFGAEQIEIGKPITITAPLTGDKTNPQGLKVDLQGIEGYFEVVEGIMANSEVTSATLKLKPIKLGRATLSIKQIKMGPNQDKEGTVYSKEYNIIPVAVAPVCGKFTFAPTTVTVGEEVTATCNLTGSKDNMDLLKVEVQGIDGKMTQSQAITPSGDKNTATIKFRATAEGSVTIKIRQTGIGEDKSQNGEFSSQAIVINAKPEAPVAGTPTYNPDRALTVGETVTVTFPLTGKKDHKELLKITTTGHEANFNIAENVTVDAEVNNATIKLRAKKDGNPTVTFKQIEKGPDKNQEGTPYQKQFTVNPKPQAPVLGEISTSKPNYNIGEEVVVNLAIPASSQNKELIKVQITGDDGTKLTKVSEGVVGDNYAIKYTAKADGSVPLVVKQIKMGPDKNKDGTPKNITVTINPAAAQ